MRGLTFGLGPFRMSGIQPVTCIAMPCVTGYGGTITTNHHPPGETMQTTVQTIPAGTAVQTPSGRRAVTVDDSTVVRNSETGRITATNLIRFSDDDEVCPGGEWLWWTHGLTVVSGTEA